MNLQSEAQSCPWLRTPGRALLEKNVLFSHLKTLPISANPDLSIPLSPTLSQANSSLHAQHLPLDKKNSQGRREPC